MSPVTGGTVDPVLVAASLVLVGGGLWTLRIAIASLRRLAAMVRTTTTTVAEVQPGAVELEGTVVSAGEAVDGTLTDDPAVVAEYRSRHTRRRGEHRDDTSVPRIPIPQQLAPNRMNRIAAVPFYLEDDSGRILVDAATADLSLEADAKTTSGTRSVREVESRLEPGDDVYVLGTAVPVEDYSADGGGGLLASLLAVLLGEHRTLPAAAVIDDEDVVVTASNGGEFLIADTAEWRGWIRQALMAALWTAIGSGFVVAGAYVLLVGLGVLPSPW